MKRAQVAAIAAIGYPLADLLGRTVRWHVDGREHHDAAIGSGRPPIHVFFHGRILPGTWYFRDRGIVVMTSENFDGEWIARIIERFGYGTARGSTSRGSTRALVQLRRLVQAGRPAAFTVDGPRGPAERVQPGCVWLASVTGSPLMPFHVEAARHWTVRSWDRTQIPKPFSRVVITFAPPMWVEPDLTPEGIEAARAALERTLLDLGDRARALVREMR